MKFKVHAIQFRDFTMEAENDTATVDDIHEAIKKERPDLRVLSIKKVEENP